MIYDQLLRAGVDGLQRRMRWRQRREVRRLTQERVNFGLLIGVSVNLLIAWVPLNIRIVYRLRVARHARCGPVVKRQPVFDSRRAILPVLRVAAHFVYDGAEAVSRVGFDVSDEGSAHHRHAPPSNFSTFGDYALTAIL